MNGRIEPNHLALLETLTGHDVRFVLVGGVALQLHGYSGATKDVDVTIAVDAANGRRVEAALSGLRSTSPVRAAAPTAQTSAAWR